ncbi:MAG: UDP-N-acetylmuramate--L-alanine ligase [Clostridiales bacterium]|nr:MAG: UDP-N-acetylmuramate--L-alanine ligase [Clostridiales bacterium]
MKSIFDVKKVHLIGIGGISMSSIAQILLSRGIAVSGSDQSVSTLTEQLKQNGATIYVGHAKKNIKDPDIVIYTGAVGNDNPEMIAAKDKAIPIIPRTVALNDILQLHQKIIAVSGTHGKSTTTSIVTHIMRHQIGEISYLIGAQLNETKRAYHLANSPFVTVEACEYQANFLHLYPTTIVVNNIEPEHIDYYKSIEQLIDTFRTFAKHLPADGHLILNRDDPNASQLVDHIGCQVTTFAIDQAADYQATNLTTTAEHTTTFDLLIDGNYVMTIEQALIGKFNVYNTLAAITACHRNGVQLEGIAQLMKHFVNSERRFERLGKFSGANVVSDYAHHPSEVKATIDDAALLANNKLCVVFQPHTYSRTKNMLAEFATAFNAADHIFIADIYAAREENIYNVSSKDLVDVICKAGKKAHYVGNLKNIPAALKAVVDEQSLIIMMGAGSIDDFARKMVDK